jgi:hypothetical protein
MELSGEPTRCILLFRGKQCIFPANSALRIRIAVLD